MSLINKIITSKLNLVRFSSQVLVIGTIISLTFFLLAIDSFKVYRSEISILVNVKSEVAEKQSARIMRNIIELPKTLSFYDRLLKNNADVKDITADLSQDERKQKWNEMFSISQPNKNSSVFKISISTTRQEDSTQLVTKTARTLFDTVAFYYDIKSDFDLRIIDGPISKAQVHGIYWIFILSIAGGFAVTIILDFFFSLGRNKLEVKSKLFKRNSFFDFKKEKDITNEKEIESLQKLYQQEQINAPFIFNQVEMQDQSVNDFEKNKKDDIKFQEIKKITKEMEPGKYPDYPEIPNKEIRQETVPANLPIAEDEFFPQYEIPQQVFENEIEEEEQSIQDSVEEVEIDTKKEPTPEELKERLNQLLRGELK